VGRVGGAASHEGAERLTSRPDGGAAYAYQLIPAGSGFVELGLQALGVVPSAHCSAAFAVLQYDVVPLGGGCWCTGCTFARLRVGEGVLAVCGAEVGAFGYARHLGDFFQGVVLVAPGAGDVVIYEVGAGHCFGVVLGLLSGCLFIAVRQASLLTGIFLWRCGIVSPGVSVRLVHPD